MQKFRVQHTDTFNGDANYAWLNEKILEVTENNISDLALVRRSKKLMGMSGVRGVMQNLGSGEEFIFRPYGLNQILFIEYIYDRETEGANIVSC